MFPIDDFLSQTSALTPQPVPPTSRTGFPNSFVIQPTSEHTHTAILLHGRGSNGEKFGAELLRSGLSSEGASLTDLLPGMKFIFPTAKKRRSSAFNRATLKTWFDIACLQDPAKRTDLQVHGLAESADHVRSILSQEMATIPPQNLVLGGLSQGCAMAFFVLLSLEFPIRGFVGMSGWLPFCKDISEIVNYNSPSGEMEDDVFFFGEGRDIRDEDPFIQTVNFVRDILCMDEIDVSKTSHDHTCFRTPVFLGHGEKDEKVNCRLGEEAAHFLTSLGMDIAWKCYPELGYWYKIPDEIDDILGFLRVKARLGLNQPMMRCFRL
jgi:predicted esterase